MMTPIKMFGSKRFDRLGGQRSLLAILIIFGSFLTGIAAAQGEPQATVKSASWDFGYIPQKCEVSHQFYIYNSGSSPLSVAKIKADCSCTSVSKIDHPIAPGDSAAIVLTFNSGRYHGLAKKSAEITTNDPQTPVQRLRIVSTVVKDGEATGDITVSPDKLKIGMNTVSVDSVKITNNGSVNLALSLLHDPGGIINKINIPSNIDPGKTANMIFHISKEKTLTEPGWLMATLAFAGKDTTIITVPIEIEK